MKVTLRSRCGRYYEVSLDDIHTDDGMVVIHPCWETKYETVRFVPEKVQKFIKRFDDSGAVRPFSFELCGE